MSNNVGNKTGLQGYKEGKLAQASADFHKALVEDVVVKQVPESTFVKEILPILTGEVVSADFPLLMAAVAGSPFSEVDIVDNAGEVLFRLPSLLERRIVNPEEAERRGSMASMLITAEQLAQQSPRRAENYLAHEFNGRGIAKNRDVLYKARHERFTTIMARYGYILNADGTVKQGAVTAKPGAPAGPTTQKGKPLLDLEDGELL